MQGTDGTCRFCAREQENLCPQSRYTGYHVDGGYAEYAIAPEAFAYRIPESFDDRTAAPLLCGGLIGYRALNRAAVPEGGNLLLVGFGSSAHLVIQLARHRGHRCYVVTRSEGHRQQARDLGAEWAGAEMAKLPERADSAILFAPAGGLVPPIMEALQPGGTFAIAGIHLTDVPGLNYERHLFHEKQIRSVTANTRADARNLLQESVAAKITPHVTHYALTDANQALADLKHSHGAGTAVLCVEKS